MAKKKKKNRERPLPPGTILSWRDVWTMHQIQKMDPDAPMLLKLPRTLTFGEWSDGSPKIATHLGFAIDDLDHLKTELYQIDENGILDLEINDLGTPKRKLIN